MVTTPNYDLDIDTTLGGNNASDYVVPSQKAIKAYVDNSTGGNVMWGNIAGTLSNQTDLQDALDDKANSADLATVATSGSYNDLSDKPTIPSPVTVDSALSTTSENPVQNKVITSALNGKLDISGGTLTGNLSVNNAASITTNGYVVGTWLQTKSASINNTLTTVAMLDGSGWIYKQSKDTLLSGVVKSVNNTSPDSNGNVALSIPTVNNATLTITQGGTTKGTFTANASSNVTIDVDAGGGASRNIGEIIASTIPLTDAGLHLLDGALIQGSGIYSAFVTYIAGLVSTYPDLFTTEANWQSTVTQYGVCGKFVYDSTNNTVRLPKITGILEGTTDVTALGDLVEAGLPNIEGKFLAGQPDGGGALPFSANSGYSASGALSITDLRDSSHQVTETSSNFNNGGAIGLDASRSSSIYGNSNTVQPQTIKVLYYIVIATSTKTDVQVDIDEIATDLNGKADRDGSNMVSSVKNFDGQWVQSYINLVSGANVTSVSSYDLSSYLPNDGYKYEVILSVHMFTDSTSGNAISCFAGSDLFDFTSSNFQNNAIRVAQVRTRTSSTMTSAGTCVIPIGSERVIKLLTPTDIAGANYSKGTLYAKIMGYRRIGTNS